MQNSGLMAPGNPRALLRFSEAKWHSNTIKSETFRFTPIECWRRLEGADSARGDAWEGATRIDQPEHVKSVKLRFGSSGEWIEHKLAGPIIYRSSCADFPATHGLCFNMLTDQMVTKVAREGKDTIDLGKFYAEFGSSLLVIDDVDRFLELVINAIKGSSQGIVASSHGEITYVDDGFHGEYSVYQKPRRFDWQREFRIVVFSPGKTGKPIDLNIPGLNRVCRFIEDFESDIALTCTKDGAYILSFTQREGSRTADEPSTSAS